MTDRQMFRIIDADKDYVLGLCWAETLASAKKRFNKDMALPKALITSSAKKEFYDEIINCNIQVNKFTSYHFDNEGKNIAINDDELNDNTIFEVLNRTSGNEDTIISMIKMYRPEEKCPRSGLWRVFNNVEDKNIETEKGDVFNTLGGRTFNYYILRAS